MPFGICTLYQINLFLSRTRLDLFFPRDCRFDIFKWFTVNQFIDVISTCETRRQFQLVFRNSPLQVIRYANVENGIVFVGHYINVVLFSHAILDEIVGDCFVGKTRLLAMTFERG
jgi:hypothetical protein